MKKTDTKQKITISVDEIVQGVPENIDRNEKMIFYYDESNNAGKFWLKPDKSGVSVFNTDIDGNFIIAGIVCADREKDFDKKESLWSRLGLSDQVQELKFSKQFSEGEFLKTIGKKRVLAFFEWLNEQHYYIHVASINIFYYGIVDIIDSVINKEDVFTLCNGYMYDNKRAEIKEDLYNVLHQHKNETEVLFQKYEYPNIKDSEQIAFCDELIQLVSSDMGRNRNLQYFVTRLEEEKKDGNLVFLKANRNNVLIEGFAQFYIHLYSLFPKSKHFFDKQNQIIKELNQVKVMDGDSRLNNYTFRDSKDVLQIQISDVISGVYGQLYTYINKKNDEDIQEDINNMDINQLNTLNLISNIQSKSNEKNRCFFYFVGPNKHRDRVSTMLKKASKQFKKKCAGVVCQKDS